MVWERAMNPYIIGTPIEDPKKFFGREDLFSAIEDNLRSNGQIFLLYGQRRIGKSSVLRQIPQRVANQKFFCVHFDCQSQTNFPIYEVIHQIAIAIVEKLEQDEIVPPSTEELRRDIEIFRHQFLAKVYALLHDKNLLLLLDEFDVLSEVDNKEFVQFIQKLLKSDSKIFIIVVVGRHHENLRSFLREAPNKEIGLLDKNSNKNLITKPSEENIEYELEAIEAIYKLSAGHPYFTQIICSTLFGKLRQSNGNNPDNNKWKITKEDVENIIDNVFEEEKAQAVLAWFWDGWLIPQQVILSAVAEAQKIAIENHTNIPEEPLNLLRKYGIITETLDDIPKQLAKYGFLDDTERRIKIELVRLWLLKSHRLKDEINKLEKIAQEKVDKLLEVADDLPGCGDSKALQTYELALKFNPNNFTTVKSLAEEYLRVENFDKAFELLMRAYKFYSISNSQDEVLELLLSLSEKYLEEQNFDKALELCELAYKIDKVTSKESLLKTRERYGHKLITQGKLDQAEEQFQKVLEIDPEMGSCLERLEEIQVYRYRSITASENTPVPVISLTPNWFTRIPKGYIALLALIAIASIFSFGAYQFLRTCPAGQLKYLVFSCKPDPTSGINHISRGDRTLFPTIRNDNRDLGIQAYNKGKYEEAAQLFDKAVKANNNDPELLIYDNNARARQKGSPLTLAVVVPADNKTNNAQEILRGVAQAQNKFNQDGGLSGRLLEIVIADDANKPEQAKQVAQELVKDQSIFGVIGHNSSEATIEALPEYEKAQLAVISPTSTSILLQSSVFFRAVTSDEVTGKKLAEYTYKNLKLKKVVIFANPKSPYSNGLREVFTKYFERLGGEIVRKPMIDLTADKFSADEEVPKSLYRYQAEAALLFPDIQHIDAAIKIALANEPLKNITSNTQGRALKLLGGNSLYTDETLSRGGKAVEGMILSVPWFRDTPQARPFAQKAIQLWGGNISWRTATSYDATQALIKSLSSNPSRTTVLDKLQNVTLSNSETSGYGLQFTPERERQSEPILVQVKDGKFMSLEQQEVK